MNHRETGEGGGGDLKSHNARLSVAALQHLVQLQPNCLRLSCRLFGKCLLLKVTEREENEAGRFLIPHRYQPIRFWLIISVHGISELIRLASFTVVTPPHPSLSQLICQDACGNHTWGPIGTCTPLHDDPVPHSQWRAWKVPKLQVLKSWSILAVKWTTL